jgi:hypothetical protein
MRLIPAAAGYPLSRTPTQCSGRQLSARGRVAGLASVGHRSHKIRVRRSDYGKLLERSESPLFSLPGRRFQSRRAERRSAMPTATQNSRPHRQVARRAAVGSEFAATGGTVTPPPEDRPASVAVGQRGEYRCSCSHVLRVFGRGRHRVYFAAGNTRCDDPVMDGACPACGGNLPGKTRS